LQISSLGICSFSADNILPSLPAKETFVTNISSHVCPDLQKQNEGFLFTVFLEYGLNPFVQRLCSASPGLWS
jgi:hypothetical protein